MQMQRFAMPREQHQQMRVERFQQSRGFERRQMQAQRVQQQRGFERRQMQAQRVEHQRGFERRQMQAQRQQMRGNQMRQAQNRGFERQQMRMQAQNQGQNRAFERQQMRANRVQQAQNRGFERQQMRANRMQQFQQQALANQQLNGRQAGRAFRGDQAQILRNQQQAYWQQLNGTNFAARNYAYQDRILAPNVVQNFVGVPVSALSGFAALSPLPASVQYLYPASPDYYYQYGDGYVYQIDRGSNLVAALIPLLAGGYLPGQYLPPAYMSSYVPDDYGFNSFYPDYGDTCNRYGDGVVYEVDCETGFVEDVIPLYANGYGVGQILPASYAYYNVPYQYRSMYYDTPDYNYWYAPGAIYQYDRRSSMITSVAALLSPGFTVGQPLPVGYDVYNVPYAYRATYYDTPNAWYRYSNGYIYQVDPTTQLVTAIVASLLT